MTKKTVMKSKKSESTELLPAYTDRGFVHSFGFDDYPDSSSYSAYVSRIKTDTGYVSCTFQITTPSGQVSLDFDSYGDDEGNQAVVEAEDFAVAVTNMVEALKKAVAIRNASRKVSGE